MCKLYLHIGYTNTISSLLKRKLFSKHPDINYLGIENQKWKKNLNLFKSSDSNEILLYITTYILHASRVEFENNLDNLKYLLSKLKLSKNKTNIISLTAFLNPAIQNYYLFEERKEKDLKNWLEKQKKMI